MVMGKQNKHGAGVISCLVHYRKACDGSSRKTCEVLMPIWRLFYPWTEEVLMIRHLTPCPEHSQCAVTAGAAPTQQNCIQAPDRCPSGEKYLDTKKIFAGSVN